VELTMLELLAAGFLLTLLCLFGIVWAAKQGGWEFLGWGIASDHTTIVAHRLLLASLLPFGGFILLGLATLTTPVQSFDRTFVYHVFRRGGPVVCYAMNTIASATDIEPVMSYVLLAALVLEVRRRLQLFWFFALALLGTVGLEVCFEAMFRAWQPDFMHREYLHPLFSGFPSGHTLRATVLAGLLLVITLPDSRNSWQRATLWGIAIAWPILTGMSLVYFDWHYPTDVVGAMLLGTSWFGVCLLLLVRLSVRHVSPAIGKI
jgi:membrane-associated phospholipid phosphatase